MVAVAICSRLSAAPPTKQTGPRQPLQLGLDAAKATQNILRLLESSTHGIAMYSDALDSIWHSNGLVWMQDNDDKKNNWKALPPTLALQQQAPSSNTTTLAPRLEWLKFSDDRTALAKIQGMNGCESFVSMLRLDADSPSSTGMLPNDGWQIVRQVFGTKQEDYSNNTRDMHAISSINSVLMDYLAIEHGGGNEDYERASLLFAPQASLLAVGTSPLDETPSDWTAPSGSLLEIPLSTFLQGVSSQSPHGNESKGHDAILDISLLNCQTAAAATVHVGNGACTTVFCDYLLLGWYDNEQQWKILSKTFTPRAWPSKTSS